MVVWFVVTLEELDLQRNNANLVQQVVDGMQQAMANDTTNDDNAEIMLQMTNSATLASGTQQQLQQMQLSMSLLQAQVTNQQGYIHPGYQGQNPGYQNQGY